MGPETLIKFGALTEEMSDLLRACVQAKLNIIIFDKTGTLTLGKPEVVEMVMSEGITEDVVLLAAGAVEQR